MGCYLRVKSQIGFAWRANLNHTIKILEACSVNTQWIKMHKWSNFFNWTMKVAVESVTSGQCFRGPVVTKLPLSQHSGICQQFCISGAGSQTIFSTANGTCRLPWCGVNLWPCRKGLNHSPNLQTSAALTIAWSNLSQFFFQSSCLSMSSLLSALRN